MSTNPPESETPEEAEEAPEPDPAARFAEEVARAVGGTSWSADHGLAKVRVDADRWFDAVAAARDGVGLPYFEFLSAIDWSNDVEVGDPPDDEVEERYEVICSLGDVVEGRQVVLSADVPKDAARIASIEPLFPGAQWHEREAAEMFGIAFDGLTNERHLYLPDRFEGHPLRKSFALLTREVKPWPGDVDVEDLPETTPSGATTQNPGA